MLTALLDALPVALGTVLATLPLVGVPLVLSMRPDRAAHLAFLAGWATGIAGLGTAVILLSDLSVPRDGAPAPWMVWVRLLLGFALIALAIRKWSKRTAGPEEEMPGWMRTFETVGATRAFGLGVLVVVANPKNAVLVASGALTIAAATYAPVAQLVALAGFTLVASLGVASPLVVTLVLGDRAEDMLAAMKGGMARHSTTIVGVVLLVLGGVIIWNAVADLPGL
jgi:hypothetical protein